MAFLQYTFTITLTQGQATAVIAETPGVIVATPYATTPVKRLEFLLVNETTVRIFNIGIIPDEILSVYIVVCGARTY
jgi:hypothetical protein